MNETRTATPQPEESTPWFPNRPGNGQHYSAPTVQVGQLRLNIDTARAPGYANDQIAAPKRPVATPEVSRVPQLDVREHQVRVRPKRSITSKFCRALRRLWP